MTKTSQKHDKVEEIVFTQVPVQKEYSEKSLGVGDENFKEESQATSYGLAAQHPSTLSY